MEEGHLIHSEMAIPICRMVSMPAIKLLDRATALTAYFSPKVIGEVNDVYVKVAKIKGDEIPWHNHAGEDELFYVIDGSLLFEIEGEDPFTMEPGDLYIVKRGANHRVSSTEECSILLVENKSTAHLGDTESEIAKSVEEQLEQYGQDRDRQVNLRRLDKATPDRKGVIPDD